MTHLASNADERGGGNVDGHPSLTVEQAAARLTRAGLSWSREAGQAAIVTYSFRATAPATMPQDAGGFERLNAGQIDAIEQALSLWSAVANIQFVRAGTGRQGEAAYSDDATILFGGYSTGVADAAAFAFLPGPTAASSAAGDVWINQTVQYMRFPRTSNDPGFATLVHEIGHAIGLLHPGDYDGEDASRTYAKDAAYAEDSLQYSIMSYFGLADTGGAVADPRWQPAGPMMDDIAAVQSLYGANRTSTAGNNTFGTGPSLYGFSPDAQNSLGLIVGHNQPLWGTIWDGGGVDTLDFSGSYVSQRIDLRPGTFSDVQGGVGTLSIALGTIIENARGGPKDDAITGNAVANGLYGGAGDDVLTGGGGDDLLDGGAGTDRVVIASPFAASTFVFTDDGAAIVTSQDGRDTLRDVEIVAFGDRALQLAPLADTDAVYRTYMGRGAVYADLAYWQTQFDGGQSLGAVRSAILADAGGYAHTIATVNALYRGEMARDAQPAELAYWDAQVKGGMDFGTVRSVIVADAGSRTYALTRIADGYEDYLGRAPTQSEATFWGNRVASGMNIADLYKTLAQEAGSYYPVEQQIAEAYSFGLGRSPTRSDLNYWHRKIAYSNVSMHEMRQTIANDSASPGLSDAATKATYELFMGRSPTASELRYWNGHARGGGSLDDMRDAILAEPVGQAHVNAKVTQLYGEFLGREPSQAERAIWWGLFQGTATPDTLHVTLMNEAASRDTLVFSAAPLNSTTVLPATMAHVVINNFDNLFYPPGFDRFAGATVADPPDRDVVDLRGTPFAGIDPLSSGHVRMVTDLNNRTGFLISYDSDHDIFLRGFQLPMLSSENFLF